MTHIPSPKFWAPRFQEFLSVEQIEYLAMQVRDSELTVRETPPHKVLENWALLQQRGNL